MKKYLIFGLCLISLSAYAKKTTYIYTDNRFNFVKIVEMDKKEAAAMAPDQPFVISSDKVANALKNIKLSRSFVMKKETETQEVFDSRGVTFLAPKISEALASAGAADKVVFSYLVKDPTFFMRNDSVTIGQIWVRGSEMHIKFDKILAKLSGDYDKRGDYSKVVSRARGLRIALEVGEGQSFGDSTDEIVINTGDSSAAIAAVAEDTKSVVLVDEKPKTTKERLKELKLLKRDGLITEDEYKEKRRDILKGL